MKSIGIDLGRWVNEGLLQFHAVRPSAYGLESHLATVHRALNEFKPYVAIVDPITNLSNVGKLSEVNSALTRLLDHLKSERITSMFTSLTSADGSLEAAMWGSRR